MAKRIHSSDQIRGKDPSLNSFEADLFGLAENEMSAQQVGRSATPSLLKWAVLLNFFSVVFSAKTPSARLSTAFSVRNWRRSTTSGVESELTVESDSSGVSTYEFTYLLSPDDGLRDQLHVVEMLRGGIINNPSAVKVDDHHHEGEKQELFSSESSVRASTTASVGDDGSLPDDGAPTSTAFRISSMSKPDDGTADSNDSTGTGAAWSADEALKQIWRTYIAAPPSAAELDSILKAQRPGYNVGRDASTGAATLAATASDGRY